MFDGQMASYTYTGFGDFTILHMILIFIHILVAHILLLNYLIAILS